MKIPVHPRRLPGRVLNSLQSPLRLAILSAGILLAGCATGKIESGSAPDQSNYDRIVHTPANFETALKVNQSALAQGKSAPDLALYNIGIILAHPANPRKDRRRAIQSFRTLIVEHPDSKWLEQSKTWIQVLEEQQKLAQEKQKLAEEKRAVHREREILLQERQKLDYTSEKSRQLDMEIDKRKRQSFSK